jgi:hypothetical protein
MTPSRVTCVIAMIFLMVSLQFLGFVPQRRTTDASHDRSVIELICRDGLEDAALERGTEFKPEGQ